MKKLLRRLTGAVLAIAFVALVFGLMANQALADPGGGQQVVQGYNIISTTPTEPAPAVPPLDTSPQTGLVTNDAFNSTHDNGSANVATVINVNLKANSLLPAPVANVSNARNGPTTVTALAKIITGATAPS